VNVHSQVSTDTFVVLECHEGRSLGYVNTNVFSNLGTKHTLRDIHVFRYLVTIQKYLQRLTKLLCYFFILQQNGLTNSQERSFLILKFSMVLLSTGLHVQFLLHFLTVRIISSRKLN